MKKPAIGYYNTKTFQYSYNGTCCGNIAICLLTLAVVECCVD